MMEVSKGIFSRMVGIVDYGGGNIGSVSNAIRKLGYEPFLLKNPNDYKTVSRIIFPGVGNFGSALGRLDETGTIDALNRAIQEGKPYLGICLGYQVLFEESQESPGIKGLGLLSGKVVKFSSGKIPHIGWNFVRTNNQSILDQGYYYFVNSYFPEPKDRKIKRGITDYSEISFCSAVEVDNIWGVQFHPEKSGKLGLNFLRRWLRC